MAHAFIGSPLGGVVIPETYHRSVWWRGVVCWTPLGTTQPRASQGYPLPRTAEHDAHHLGTR